MVPHYVSFDHDVPQTLTAQTFLTELRNEYQKTEINFNNNMSKGKSYMNVAERSLSNIEQLLSSYLKALLNKF